MLFGNAKLAGLLCASVLALVLGYAIFFTDTGATYFRTYVSAYVDPYVRPYFDKDFFKAREVDLPDIQVEKINKRSNIPQLSKDLFGVLPSVAKPVVETKLNLSLKGTFPSSTKEEGRAVIANGRKEQLFHVGEEVIRGVTLVEVFSDYVLLDRANVREILRFPTSDTPNFVPSTTGITITETADQQVKARRVVDAELLEKYKAQLLEDPRETLSSIGLKLVNNRYQVIQGSVLAKAGFKPKDEIISINGQPIKVLLNNPRTMKAILSIGSVRIGFLRERKRLSLNFKLN
ncbi:type II secretion system protein N [Marinomonas transparens]|nr:type II secretion system protein N [Marinomonas transparens]